MRMVLDHPDPTGTMGATPGGFKNMKRPRVVSATGGMDSTRTEALT